MATRKRHHYSAKRSLELLRKSFEVGDRVFTSRVPGNYYVTSESRPWHVHIVNFTTDEFCDCEASFERGECRHVVRASWYAQNQFRKRTGQPLVPAPKGFNLDGSRISEAA